MTPHVIIPDVNRETIDKFKNILTNITGVCSGNSSFKVDKEVGDLEEFFNAIELDKAMFTYREKVDLNPKMEDMDMEYNILIESLMKDKFDLDGTGVNVNLRMTNTNEANSTDYFDTEIKKFSETKQFTEEVFNNPTEYSNNGNDLEAFFEEIDSMVTESKDFLLEVKRKVKLEPEYFCDICEKHYNLKSQLKSCYTRHFYKHLKIMFGDFVDKRTKSCHICNKEFKTEKRVFMHIGIKHNKIEEIINTLKNLYLQRKNLTKKLV